MKKWYQKDGGQTLLYGECSEIKKQHPTAVKIPDRPTIDHIWENNQWIINPNAYINKRQKEYPSIGDQLDAILKHFNYMQMTMANVDISLDEKIIRCCNLVGELDDIIAQWLNIKKKYPKENK